MTDPTQTELPDGVRVSSDAGTPSAFEGLEPLTQLGGQWAPALEALEFADVLRSVAERAAGPLGREAVLALGPVGDADWIREELALLEELARLIRMGQGVAAEAVPPVAPALARLRISGSVLDGGELLALCQTLTAARLIMAEIKRVAPEAPRVAALELPPAERAFERRLEQAIDDDGAVRDTASPGLAAARSEIQAARNRLIQRLEAMLRAAGGEGGVTLREGRYVIPVARDQRSRPEGIVHGESASGATLFIEPTAAIGLGNAVREAEANAAREELKVLRGLTEMLRPAAAQIGELHALAVRVDSLVARARWAVSVSGHAPVVTHGAELRVAHGRHPLLLVGDAPREVVPFDLHLADGECCVLISGPNTGGKSVLLKAVGLAVALAQSGFIPPVGPGSVLPLITRLYADIGDRQSIADNLSTFSAHLTRLRSILEEADEQSLVLLDEIGSGTDPAEGGALAAATLLALTRRRAVTLATTHLGALKRLATSAPGIVNASLQFDAATLQPTYRLVKGVPGRSYALAIARRLGLPEEVLLDAESQVPASERHLDALLASVERRERDQMVRESGLATRAADLEAQAQGLAAQAEGQSVREASLKRRERDAERAAREQARTYLLEARDKVEAAIARAGAAGADAAREARREVEQAASEAAAALRALEQPVGGSAGGTPPSLAPGDRVRLEGGPTGEVLELRADGKAVVRVGSLKLVVEPSTVTILPGEVGRSASPSAYHEPPERAASYEVDLRGMTGDEAEQSVLAAVDAAVLAEQPYLRIIHGKGTGVVRERVRRVLELDRRVARHGFAPANQGGSGVTVAEFGA